MAQTTYPHPLPMSEPLRKDLGVYFPLWTVMDMRIIRVRRGWFTAKWTVAFHAKSHTLEAAGISLLDLENRMLEVMRRKLDPKNRTHFVRSAR